MPRLLALETLLVVSLLSSPQLSAQAPYVATPYSAQLKSDPAVGNVQGMQRYGRPLKTDPDQGIGYSYHVYPVAHPSTVGVATTTGGQQQENNESIAERVGQQVIEQIRGLPAGALGESGGAGESAIETMGGASSGDQENLENAIREAASSAVREAMTTAPNSTTTIQNTQVVGPIAGPGPFDWTSGIRNYASPGIPISPQFMSPAERLQEHMLRAEAIAVSRARGDTEATPTQIYHQPLVQIKMRVVEVARTDGLAVSSVLEYVSEAGTDDSYTSGNTTNNEMRNFRSLTRYAIDDIVTDADNGVGTLANLTSEHINWLVQAIATENNADVITAPEIVTLNGQNAEFVAGSKLPFELGQNVITGQAQNIQQVFYKHVGTMVSVTPRIVNWGLHGEGRGERSIQSQDITDWPKLLEAMNVVQQSKPLFYDRTDPANPAAINFAEYLLVDEKEQVLPLPYSKQSIILNALNEYSRQDLAFLVGLAEQGILSADYCERCTTWQPSDCTIDLSVVVRLSEPSMTSGGANLGNEPIVETNIRAVSNVIQLKSGNGVVMAGLIGEREIEEISKTPILGDLPVVGSLFRAKTVDRVKTEVLVFLEAEVLDPDPHIARAESYEDFILGRDFVNGELLDNPLEVGLHRAGIGPYLPAYSECECIFWEKYHRKLRKMRTHAAEILEP